MFIQHLNQRMEQLHSSIFSNYYKDQLMYYKFYGEQPMFKAAKEFEATYEECHSVDK